MEQINIKQLVETFESDIKGTVAKKFNVHPDELSIMSDQKSGIYLSKEEPNTLCCFVLGNKTGFLFLVTSKISEDGKGLKEFKSDVVS